MRTSIERVETTVTGVLRPMLFFLSKPERECNGVLRRGRFHDLKTFSGVEVGVGEFVCPATCRDECDDGDTALVGDRRLGKSAGAAGNKNDRVAAVHEDELASATTRQAGHDDYVGRVILVPDVFSDAVGHANGHAARLFRAASSCGWGGGG